MLFPPNPRLASPPGSAMALPGVAILSAAQPLLSHHAPLSQRGMPLLCSLAMHGLLFAAALWFSLPKPSHAPRPEPFMTVQFVAAPPAPVAASAPAQAAAPPSPVSEPETAVSEPETAVREVTPEPAAEAPPPLVTQSAADSVPAPLPQMAPKPVVKPKPQPRVAARLPETKPVETKPVQAPQSEVAAEPQPVQQPIEVPAPPAAPATAVLPAPPAAVVAAPAEIQSNEPPVLRHPGFRNRPQPPVYPLRARQMEQEGVSVVRALIDPEGQSREVRLWRSSGYEMLDQAALNAVRGWAFNAARVGDRPVLAWVEIPVQFKLR